VTGEERSRRAWERVLDPSGQEPTTTTTTMTKIRPRTGMDHPMIRNGDEQVEKTMKRSLGWTVSGNNIAVGWAFPMC
jgi:hypothetical protein